MSVQSGRTYEQEFALEIAKAKGAPAARLLYITAAVLCNTRLQDDKRPHLVPTAWLFHAGGQGEEHALGLVIPGAAADLAR